MRKESCMKTTNKSLWEIFKFPLFLALVSIIGLVLALLDDGLFDVMAWVLLSIPIYVCRRIIKFSPNKTFN